MTPYVALFGVTILGEPPRSMLAFLFCPAIVSFRRLLGYTIRAAGFWAIR